VNSSIVNTIADLSNHLLTSQGLAQQVFDIIRNQKKIQLAVKGRLPKIVE
jgi:hypothetical protein